MRIPIIPSAAARSADSDFRTHGRDALDGLSAGVNVLPRAVANEIYLVTVPVLTLRSIAACFVSKNPNRHRAQV